MFALVADVESYPQFVPLCQSLHVRGRHADGDTEVLVADMTIAYAVARETFTTQVTLDRPALVITAKYVDGPFHHLDSRWSFVARASDASIVHFAIDYEFRSRLLATLMGSMFDVAFRKFAQAFEARADKVYGRRQAVS